MGVNIKQATYAGPGVTGNPPVPSSGDSQPIEDTASNATQPGVRFGSQPTGNREKNADPPVPTCGRGEPATFGTDGLDTTPADILKGGRGNG